MFLEIGEPRKGLVTELALVRRVLCSAEREGRLGVAIGGVGGARGARRRRGLRRRRRPGAARRAAHAAQRLCITKHTISK